MHTKKWTSWLRKLSIVLTAAMLFTGMPVSAFADTPVSDNGTVSSDAASENKTSDNQPEVTASADKTVVSESNVLSSAELASVTLSEGTVRVVSSDRAFTVTNNLSSNSIYAYVVSDNNGSASLSSSCIGEKILSHNSISISTYYNTESNNRLFLSSSTNYILCISSNELFSPEKAIKIKVKTTSANTAVTTSIEDGSIIKMKAVTDRNSKVRISWGTSADHKDYRYYTLSKLAKDGSTWKVVQDSRGNEFKDKSSRSFTDTKLSDQAGNYSVYMVTCYTKAQHDAGCQSYSAQYISVAAPYLYYAESMSSDTMQYCFTELNGSASLSYRLEAATANAESSKKAGGYCDDQSVTYTKADVGDTILYGVSGKVSVNAARCEYSNTKYRLQNDTRYYCRVKGQYTFGGKTFTSAPSNVLSLRQGLARCEIFYINGENPNNENDRAHRKDYGTCYRKGFIVFTEVPNAYKYQLLRCNTQYGRYSVIKTYRASDSKHVISVTDKTLTQYFGNLYYMTYNNFTPERTYYYAVRAVDSHNVAGGFGDGFGNTTDMDKVQEFAASTYNDKSIVLTWISDPCVKQYLIYRVDGTDTGTLAKTKGTSTKNTPTLEKIVGNHVAVKGTSENYCRYYDKGLNAHSTYSYIVRPVYDSKKAKDQEYSSYSSYLSDPDTASTNNIADYPKSVYASNYDSHHLMVKWSSVAGTTGYQVQYALGNPNSSGFDCSENSNSWKTITDNTYSKSTSLLVGNLTPGQTYYFRVRAYDGKTWSGYSIKYKGAKPTPLAATNFKVTTNSDSSYMKAKLTWNTNSRENNNGITYEIYKDGTYAATVAGTEWTDTTATNRGESHTYYVRSFYGSVAGAATSSVKFCRPSSIYFVDGNGNAISNLTLIAGNSATVRVYFNPSDTTVRKMDTFATNNASICTIDATNDTDHEYATVTIRAVAPGTCSIQARATNYSQDTANLVKNLQVTVVKQQ